MLEIIVLFAGARSGVGGLKEVCVLAAVTLAWDCLLLCTLFSAILTIMVEVRRIKTLRSTISRTSSMASMRGLATKITAYTPSGSPRTSALKHAVEPNSQSPPTSPSIGSQLQKRVESVLGVKGAMLGKGRLHDYDEERNAERESPVARLKLLLIASFLTLHVLNLITPLTSGPRQRAPQPGGPVGARKVDIATPAVQKVLDELVRVEVPVYTVQDVETSWDRDVELLVRVDPPLHVSIAGGDVPISGVYRSPRTITDA